MGGNNRVASPDVIDALAGMEKAQPGCQWCDCVVAVVGSEPHRTPSQPASQPASGSAATAAAYAGNLSLWWGGVGGRWVAAASEPALSYGGQAGGSICFRLTTTWIALTVFAGFAT